MKTLYRFLLIGSALSAAGVSEAANSTPASALAGTRLYCGRLQLKSNPSEMTYLDGRAFSAETVYRNPSQELRTRAATELGRRRGLRPQVRNSDVVSAAREPNFSHQTCMCVAASDTSHAGSSEYGFDYYSDVSYYVIRSGACGESKVTVEVGNQRFVLDAPNYQSVGPTTLTTSDSAAIAAGLVNCTYSSGTGGSFVECDGGVHIDGNIREECVAEIKVNGSLTRSNDCSVELAP